MQSRCVTPQLSTADHLVYSSGSKGVSSMLLKAGILTCPAQKSHYQCRSCELNMTAHPPSSCPRPLTNIPISQEHCCKHPRSPKQYTLSSRGDWAGGLGCSYHTGLCCYIMLSWGWLWIFQKPQMAGWIMCNHVLHHFVLGRAGHTVSRPPEMSSQMRPGRSVGGGRRWRSVEDTGSRSPPCSCTRVKSRREWRTRFVTISLSRLCPGIGTSRNLRNA